MVNKHKPLTKEQLTKLQVEALKQAFAPLLKNNKKK